MGHFQVVSTYLNEFFVITSRHSEKSCKVPLGEDTEGLGGGGDSAIWSMSRTFLEPLIKFVTYLGIIILRH